jgi:hypothetical protein
MVIYYRAKYNGFIGLFPFTSVCNIINFEIGISVEIQHAKFIQSEKLQHPKLNIGYTRKYQQRKDKEKRKGEKTQEKKRLGVKG